MPTKKPPAVPPEVLFRYEALVSTLPEVERKGATMPYTSRNGHMFSFITTDGTVALRLPSPEREAFLAKHSTALATQHGSVLKEYVVVPDALLAKTKELAVHFAASHAYVGAMAPKASAKKRSAKTKAPRGE